MPTVPSSDRLGLLQPRGDVTPFQSPGVPGGAFQASPAPAIAGAVVNQGLQQFQRVQAERNAIKTTKALADGKRSISNYLNDPDSGVFTLLEDQTEGITDRSAEWLDTEGKRIAATLPKSAQRTFLLEWGNQTTATLDRVAVHERNQHEASKQRAIADLDETEISAVFTNPEEFDASVDKVTGGIAAFGDADIREDMIEDFKERATKAGISGYLAAGDPRQAQRFLDEHGDNLDPADRLKIGTELQKDVDRRVGFELADAVQHSDNPMDELRERYRDEDITQQQMAYAMQELGVRREQEYQQLRVDSNDAFNRSFKQVDDGMNPDDLPMEDRIMLERSGTMNILRAAYNRKLKEEMPQPSYTARNAVMALGHNPDTRDLFLALNPDALRVGIPVEAFTGAGFSREALQAVFGETIQLTEDHVKQVADLQLKLRENQYDPAAKGGSGSGSSGHFKFVDRMVRNMDEDLSAIETEQFYAFMAQEEDQWLTNNQGKEITNRERLQFYRDWESLKIEDGGFTFRDKPLREIEDQIVTPGGNVLEPFEAMDYMQIMLDINDVTGQFHQGERGEGISEEELMAFIDDAINRGVTSATEFVQGTPGIAAPPPVANERGVLFDALSGEPELPTPQIAASVEREQERADRFELHDERMAEFEALANDPELQATRALGDDLWLRLRTEWEKAMFTVWKGMHHSKPRESLREKEQRRGNALTRLREKRLQGDLPEPIDIDLGLDATQVGETYIRGSRFFTP